MRKWLTRTCLTVLVLVGAGMWHFTAMAADSADAAIKRSSRQVLVLHSYHPGLLWTDNIMQGMQSVFADGDLDVLLNVEYLDSKRNVSPDYLPRIDDFLQYKLAEAEFDLILVSDNDAFDFVLRHRDTLFAGVPIVFCGVNNFQPAMLEDLSGITGIAELPSFFKTIEQALSLHPATEEVVILAETQSVTGRANLQVLRDVIQRFSPTIRFVFWNDVSLAELQQRLAGLNARQLVLLTGALSDERGRVYSFVESCRLVREVCSVPLYGFWDFFLGQGIVGGHLVSGVRQGELAAELGLRILHGESPDSIPVISKEANLPMFDDRELRRFGLSAALLPKGSVVINQPPSFYPVNKRDFWVAVGLTLILLGSVALLLWSRSRRKKIEATLRVSEERLRLALAGSQDGTWDWNAVTGKNIVDERWCSMLGYTKAEIGENFDQWQSLVHPDDLPAITQAHQECIVGKISHFSGEFRMRTKAGDWKWILGRGAVVERDSAGRPQRLTGTHKDISDQKADEAALKNALAEAESSREKINAILRSIADALIFTDTQGHIILMNPLAEELFNVRYGMVAGKDVRTVIDAPGFSVLLETVLAGNGEQASGELELHHPQLQEVRVFQVRVFEVVNQEGGRAGAVTVLQDVTKSREMDRMKNEFISTAAHELRTPLTVILGFSELLLSDCVLTDEQRRDFLMTIVKKTENLSALVSDLLDLSRMESGGLICLNKDFCDVADLVLPLVEQYRNLYPARCFDVSLPPASLILELDRGKTSQVLENLLSNAVKYSPDGGPIRVTVSVDSKNLRVSVADEGIGMTPQQASRVFDKFYRADAGNTAIGGLGLGMAIARGIVEAHGGNIWVESEFGRGTTATFTLPLPTKDGI